MVTTFLSSIRYLCVQMTKIKKHKLFLEDEIEGEVYGISSGFSDYRLAWEMNAAFSIQLEKQENPLFLEDKRSKNQVPFFYYQFTNDEDFVRFTLIKNKQNNSLVKPEKALMDYFLVIQENYILTPEDIIRQLRAINGVVAVFEFESNEFDFIAYLEN